jgi:hypothetical protein
MGQTSSLRTEQVGYCDLSRLTYFGNRTEMFTDSVISLAIELLSMTANSGLQVHPLALRRNLMRDPSSQI